MKRITVFCIAASLVFSIAATGCGADGAAKADSAIIEDEKGSTAEDEKGNKVQEEKQEASPEEDKVDLDLETHIICDELEIQCDSRGTYEDTGYYEPEKNYGFEGVEADMVTWTYTEPYESDDTVQLDHIFRLYTGNDGTLGFMDFHENIGYARVPMGGGDLKVNLIEDVGPLEEATEKFNDFDCRGRYEFAATGRSPEKCVKSQVGILFYTENQCYSLLAEVNLHGPKDSNLSVVNEKVPSPYDDPYLRSILDSIRFVGKISEVSWINPCFDEVLGTMHFWEKDDLSLSTEGFIAKFGQPDETEKDTIKYHVKDESGGYTAVLQHYENNETMRFFARRDADTFEKKMGSESDLGNLSRFGDYVDEFNVSDYYKIEQYVEDISTSQIYDNKIYPYEGMADFYSLDNYKEFTELLGTGNIDTILYDQRSNGVSIITIRWIYPEKGLTIFAEFDASSGERRKAQPIRNESYIPKSGEDTLTESGKIERYIEFERSKDGSCTATLYDYVCFDTAQIEKAKPGDTITSKAGGTFKVVTLEEACEPIGDDPGYYRGSDEWANVGVEVDGNPYFLNRSMDVYYAEDSMWGLHIYTNPRAFSFTLNDEIEVDLDRIIADGGAMKITGTEFMEIPTNPSGNSDWEEGIFKYKGHEIIKPGEVINGMAVFEDGTLKSIMPECNSDLVS
ncbi:MAG: hypothetical protein K6F53_11745 [Lachnospiraceae bacterium]|nr:hypothetical protein [Lachnospiraceae bacterium]